MKRENMVSLALVALFLTSVFPLNGFSVASHGSPEVFGIQSVVDPVDWWPMFHHDQTHTGYSTSTGPNTNQTLWNHTTGGYVESSPAVTGGIVFVGSDDDKVYALNASTGVLVWSYTTNSWVTSSPAVEGGTVYVGSTDGRVYALNGATGAYMWSYATSGSVYYSSPAVASGIVCVGSYDHKVYALNVSTGVLVWSYTTGGYTSSSPAVAGGKVFVGSTDGSVYALNASTGALVWSYTTGNYVDSSPAIADGVVFVGSEDGKIYAFGQLLSVSISPSSVLMDVGQSQLFISNVMGETSPYTYQWYLNGAPVSGATNPTWTFTPTSVGSYTVYVNITDALSHVATSGTVPITVNLQLSVSVLPASATLDVGQSQLFTSTVSGGTPPYSYQWYLNNAAVSGATFSNWTFTPASAASNIVYLNVTDSVGAVATSATVPVTVNGPLSVSIAPNSVTMDVGQKQLFTSAVSGGTSPFTYQWYANGAAVSGATNVTWAFSPSSSGSYNIYINVTDNVGFRAKSNIANVAVNPALSVSVSPSAAVMSVNQSQLFTSSVTGGTPHYTYQWYLNGTSVSGATDATWNFTLASAGAYMVYVEVNDGAGAQATSNTAKVNFQLSIGVLPVSGTLDVDQSQLFTSNVSGGATPYLYQWYLNDAPVIGATSPSWVFAPGSVGSYTVYVNVTDAVGAVATSGNVSVTVNGLLSVSVVPSSVIMDVGQKQLFTCAVSGGTSPFTYQWYSNGTAVPGATTSTWNFTPSSSGSYNVYANVTDSVGVTAKSNVVAVPVNPGFTVTVSPTSIFANVNQSQLFTSNVSGGTPPYSYQWYLNDLPVSDAVSSNWNFTPPSIGSFTVYVKVNDTVGIQATSNTAYVQAGIHDVAVTSVTSSKTVIGRGYGGNITVAVQDQGNFSETFKVTVYANTTSVGSQNVTLSSGNSTNFTFTWNTTGFVYGNYTISAYAWPVPGETNTANNNGTDGLTVVTIPGDLNGDLTVGLQDLVILANAYGSRPGNLNWNANADIDNYGVVRLSDLVIMAIHYGQHYP